MNKLVWGGVATVVLAAYVGGTVYARSQVPSVYKEISAEAAKKFPMAQLSHKVLSQGLFSSKVEVTVKLGCGTDAKEAFKYIDTLTHGPFLWTHGFGKMYIETELVMDDKSKADIAKVFGKDKPLTIATKVGFSGAATVSVSSPAKNFTDEDKQAQVKWGGLQSELTIIDVKKGQFDNLKFDMPELTVTEENDKSHFSILGAKASATQTGMAGEMALSKAEFSVKTILVENEAKHLNFNASDFTVDAANTASGEFMAISENFGVKSIKVNDRDYGPVSIKLLLNHLHIPSFMALQKDMETAQAMVCSDPVASQAGVMAAIQKHGTTIMTKVPEVVLESVKAKFPEGEVSLSAKASVPGFTEADAGQGLMALAGVAMQKLKAEGNLTAAEGVLKYFAQLSPMGASFDKTSAAAVDAGLLVRKGSDFTINAKWENGAALINGLSQAEVMQKMQTAMMQQAQADAAPAEEDPVEAVVE